MKRVSFQASPVDVKIRIEAGREWEAKGAALAQHAFSALPPPAALRKRAECLGYQDPVELSPRAEIAPKHFIRAALKASAEGEDSAGAIKTPHIEF